MPRQRLPKRAMLAVSKELKAKVKQFAKVKGVSERKALDMMIRNYKWN